MRSNEKTGSVPIDPHRVQLSSSIHLARSKWPSANWWQVWNDPQLNHLIETALNQSPEIHAARMRVSEATSGVALARSVAGLQSVAMATEIYTRSLSHNQQPLVPLTPLDTKQNVTTAGPWYTLGIVGIGARLKLDIWGADRATVQAAIGKQNASLAEEAGIELDMTATVAQLYYGIQTNYRQITLLKEARAITDLSLRAHARRLERGLENLVDLENAKAEKFSVEQKLVIAEGKSVQLHESLRALLGLGPNDLPSIRPVQLPQLQKNLPPSLDFELLARRPDLQAYRWYIESSYSKIHSAQAAFFPHFDIKAFWGYNSLHVKDLVKHSFQPFSLVPGVYLPLFNSGGLNANLTAAESASNLAIEQYNQAVLNAVRDVATLSSQLYDLDRQARLQTGKVTAAMVGKNSAQAHFQRGLISYYSAQEARQALIAAQLAQLDIEAQRLSTDIMLTKALGGGYRGELMPIQKQQAINTARNSSN